MSKSKSPKTPLAINGHTIEEEGGCVTIYCDVYSRTYTPRSIAPIRCACCQKSLMIKRVKEEGRKKAL